MNDVTITLSDGSIVVLTQEEIVSPPFNCCLSGSDYIKRVMRGGVVYEVLNVATGMVDSFGISPHCICQVEFTRKGC